MTRDPGAVALFGITAALMLTCAASGQQRFSSRVAGVRVDVLVTDASRRVAGLRADEFELRDDGVVQQIRALEVERVPLDVICVFDTSGSVAGLRLRELVAAGRSLVDQLRESDELALLPFASHVSLAVPLTGDHARLRDAFSSLTASGTTSLRDATFAGLTMEAGDTARTLVIVFSDGDDTSSWLTPPRVMDAARRTDVVVYAVLAPPQFVTVITVPGRGSVPPGVASQITSQMEQHDKQHRAFLANIAAETGGKTVALKADSDLTGAFTSILGEFRDRYVLSFVPSGVKAGGWHTLDVKVKGKSAKVTARRGYFGS
jgi:Ca-activated chloride channel homolog